jgi:hypothetical protein
MFGIVINSINKDNKSYYSNQVQPVQYNMQHGILEHQEHEHREHERREHIKHETPTLCEATLNKEPKHDVKPSLPFNEHPGFVQFHSSCQPYPKPNPELAESGTGVGLPAYEDINEFPAPYQNEKKKCNTRGDKHFFNVQPSDVNNETNGIIDYTVHAPLVGGLACYRPHGIGEPAFEKNNEFPAPYEQSGGHRKCC